MFRSTKKTMAALLTASISLALLTGCGDTTGADSSLGKANFSMKAGTVTRSLSNRAVLMTDPSGTVFSITEARVNVRHIEFDLDASDSTNDSTSNDASGTKVVGPFIIDLITGISTPEIGEIELPVGNYKRIDVRLDDVSSSDSTIDNTDELYENTLIIKGTFDYTGNSSRAFSIRLKLNEDVRFESLGGLDISSVGIADILLTLNVAEWLEDTDITKALDDETISLESDGSLVLTDESAGSSDIENSLKTTIKNKYDLDD